MNTNHLFTAFGFIGFVLCAIPFLWHLQAWNTATCFYMLWVGLACLNYAVNSIIWDNNLVNWAPVYCDISTKFSLGAGFGLILSVLAINRRLFYISQVKVASQSKADKRRGIFLDLFICLGIPLFLMAIHFFFQGHRFDIYEDFGCLYSVFDSPPGFVYNIILPLLIGLTSSFYSIRTIRNFYYLRLEFDAILASYDAMSRNRYMRLMLLAAVNVLFSLPVMLKTVIQRSNTKMYPYISLHNAHIEFSRVDYFPNSEWKTSLQIHSSIEFIRWPFVACALLFFAFFGFSEDALKNYCVVFARVSKAVSWSSRSASFAHSGTSSTSGSLSSKTEVGPVRLLHLKSSQSSIGTLSDVSSFDGYSEKIKTNKSVTPVISFSNISFEDVGALADVPASISTTSRANSEHVKITPLPQFPTHEIDPTPIRSDSINEKAHTHDIV